MHFETLGEKGKPVVLFFHAMGVVGESSEPVAQFLRERYFCVMPTSSVYCAGEHYVSKEDEIRQVEDFLRVQGVRELALVVSSSLGADLAAAFPGGKLVFDAAGKSAVKLMLKTWIKSAKIRDVGAYFSVEDPENELRDWAPGLRVSQRGYMLGYHDLRDPSVSGFFRFLSKVGDGRMKMRIVRLDFGKEGENG